MAKVDEEQLRRIEELVRQVEEIADPKARETAGELMQAVLALHGAGIERMLELVAESASDGDSLIRRLAGDNLVSSLLVLHGLHPDDLSTRVQQILAKQSFHAELVGVIDGVVRVRLAPGGCHSNSSAQAVEALLRDALPDAAEVLVEEGLPQNGFVPLSSLETITPVLAKG